MSLGLARHTNNPALVKGFLSGTRRGSKACADEGEKYFTMHPLLLHLLLLLLLGQSWASGWLAGWAVGWLAIILTPSEAQMP